MFKHAATSLYDPVLSDWVVSLFAHRDTRRYCDKTVNPLLIDLFASGNEYESTIVKRLKESNPVVSLKRFNDSSQIIYNAQHPIFTDVKTYDPSSGLYGIADLLIRGDVVKEVLKTIDIHYNGPVGNGYVLFDIKCTRDVTESQLLPAYNCQLDAYKRGLSVKPIAEYLLYGTGNKGALYRAKINELDTNNAVEWLNLTKSDASLKWNAYEPHENRLYPNMKRGAIPYYDQVKSIVAESIGEITLLPHLTVEDRALALEHGVNSYRHNRFDLDIFNLTELEKSDILNAIKMVDES